MRQELNWIYLVGNVRLERIKSTSGAGGSRPRTTRGWTEVTPWCLEGGKGKKREEFIGIHVLNWKPKHEKCKEKKHLMSENKTVSFTC